MLRFTIRDVLWLMVVVGMGVAAYANHFRLSAKLLESERARARAATDAALLAHFSFEPSRGDLAKLRAKYDTMPSTKNLLPPAQKRSNP